MFWCSLLLDSSMCWLPLCMPMGTIACSSVSSIWHAMMQTAARLRPMLACSLHDNLYDLLHVQLVACIDHRLLCSCDACNSAGLQLYRWLMTSLMLKGCHLQSGGYGSMFTA